MESSLGVRRRTGFAIRDPPVWLAVATTNLGFAMCAGARFSELLNWRVFQQYRREADIADPGGGPLKRSGFYAIVVISLGLPSLPPELP
jgi:hypothetical protein